MSIEKDAVDLYEAVFKSIGGGFWNENGKLTDVTYPGPSPLKEEFIRLSALALTEYWEKMK